MKKKGVLFVLLFLLVLFPLIYAATDSDDGPGTVSVDNTSSDIAKKNKAYDCLTTLVEEQTCESLSTEEKAFVLLSIGECSEELSDDAQGDRECWPGGNCRIKETALSILARDKAGLSSGPAQEWLISQNTTPSDVTWYLQVDSNSETSCSVTYDGSSHPFVVQEDKKISSSAGTCLSKSQEGYWFRIASQCYGKEFQITCDQGFLTSLLFTKTGSNVLHVPEGSHSASAEGTQTEKVNSYCFANQGSSTTCDYEGSLWATMILSYLEYDVSSFLPYLISMSEENKQFLPEAFLYSVTGHEQYRSDILAKQKASKYWQESSANDAKFYDTAVALFPFVNERPSEKENAIAWLLEQGVQNDAGCWKNNVRNTAFLLAAIWPRNINLNEEPDLDCQDSGYFCMPSADCTSAGGNVLSEFKCAGVSSCCSQQEQIPTCAEQTGVICESGQRCQGSEVRASDTTISQICCKGSCSTTSEISQCEQQGGRCENSCSSGFEEAVYSCDSTSQTCCVRSSKPNGGFNWTWIIILLILIILVVLAIIFRDKLKIFWMRISSKFGKGKSSSDNNGPKGPPGRGLPGPPGRPFRRPTLNQIRPSNTLPSQGPPRKLVPNSSPPGQQKISEKKPSELDDVLNKLKSMGK